MPLLRCLWLSVVVVAATLLLSPASSMASNPATTLGVYVGPNAPAKVAQWDQWRGGPAAKAVDFLARDTWTNISTPTWWINGWGASAYKDRMVYSIPMLPADTTTTMQKGVTGTYDGYFTTLARTLVAAGQGSSVLRIGWEFNGDWYRWAAGPDPAAFTAYFRRIVTAMRAVSPSFKIEWTANAGPSAMPADLAYPGDAYVDTIGLDNYDQYWGSNPSDPEVRWNHYLNQPYGLVWHRNFAAAHGKPMTFPEWGVVHRGDGYGGNDDPVFVQHMYDWIAANNVAWHAYFEYDGTVDQFALMTGRFPDSAAVFLNLFGAPVTTAPSPITPITAPVLTPGDTIPPSTAIKCNAAACSGAVFSKSVTVALKPTDTGGSGVNETRYTVDGSQPTPTHGAIYKESIVLTKSVTLRFASWDIAGNGEAPKSQKLRVR